MAWQMFECQTVGRGARDLWTDLIRFVAGEAGTAGRDWEIVWSEPDDEEGNVQEYSESGSLTITQLDTWLNLPTAAAYDFSCNKDGTSLEEGTDYELDVDRGRFKALSGGALGVDDVVTYSYKFKRPKIVLHHTGLSGEESVYVGFCLKIKSDGVEAGILVKCYRHFDGSMSFYDTVFGNRDGDSGKKAFVPFWNNGMRYWVFSNKMRIVLVVLSQTYYSFAYAGMFWRFAMPHEYPYPLIVLTDGYYNGWGDVIEHDEEDDYRHMVVGGAYTVSDPNTGRSVRWNACAVCSYDNYWKGRTSYMLLPMDRYEVFLWQHHYPTGARVGMFPIYIQYGGLLGELDGVYYVPGADWQPQMTVGQGDEFYVLFPDVWRVDWKNWFAVRED